MMNSLFFLNGFGILTALFFIIIPALIGVFVYTDAPKYNMDRLLWILISILIPSYIGFVAYLIISRLNLGTSSNTYTKACPSCRKRVEKEYNICPYCGSILEKHCPNCGKKVEGNFSVCPYCSFKLK